ncbi:hypothetical protein ACFZBE_20430 [Streptomyces sp. NPDC008061]|uniref:hypothetical protein n=1 Tax=Streptomyces sp. NPDC008061 TaxID=3364805 RepID=UPI0036E42168
MARARAGQSAAGSRKTRGIHRRVIGPAHPDTLVSRRKGVEGLGWLGPWVDTSTEYRLVADALGTPNPAAYGARPPAHSPRLSVVREPDTRGPCSRRIEQGPTGQADGPT